MWTIRFTYSDNVESEIGKRAHDIKVENETWLCHIAGCKLEEMRMCRFGVKECRLGMGLC